MTRSSYIVSYIMYPAISHDIALQIVLGRAGAEVSKTAMTIWNYIMAYRNVFEVQKQWQIKVVRCVNEWANDCWDANEMTWKRWHERISARMTGMTGMTECMNEWMNEWMNQSINESVSEPTYECASVNNGVVTPQQDSKAVNTKSDTPATWQKTSTRGVPST